MKLFLIALLSLTSLTSVAQKKTKASPQLSKKIETTPVATMGEKGVFTINPKLGKTMPDGSKITSMYVHFTVKGKRPLLAAEFTNKGRIITGYVILEQRGNSFYVENFLFPDMDFCGIQACTSCESYIVGSGTVVCDCLGGDTPDCTVIDISYPVIDIMERLFP